MLAAATETKLLDELVAALPCEAGPGAPRVRLVQSPEQSQRQLVATLLFLSAVGLHRPWDLRGYTGDGLALLSGRQLAYGYEHTERFLAQVAQAGGDQAWMVATASWSQHVWGANQETVYYIDMHRKPVYTEASLPRGLIGRSGKVLDCRALALLHDEEGHPLIATTHRGDTHLTQAFSHVVDTYHQAVGTQFIQTVVLDREGMGADFLLGLQGRCAVITLLRSNQYRGESSFMGVEEFTPLTLDREGNVIREVAPACYTVTSPEDKELTLSLTVALIRDWSRPIPSSEPRLEGSFPLSGDEPVWWEADYEAKPTPPPTTEPKLIAVVSTDPVEDVVDLVTAYKRRWPAQENIIRDFLLPLGLDTNHGYAKTAVVNSEVAKRRQAAQTQRENVVRWRAHALEKSQRASRLYHRRWEKAKERSETLYRQLNWEQTELEGTGVPGYQLKRQIKEKQALIDAELDAMWARAHKAMRDSNHEWQKAQRYAHKERQLLRQLENLDSQEKQMYELDNRKDQIMTTLRLALTNLVMWTRNQFFPDSYAHATWKRLAPFFHLPGLVVDQAEQRVVYLQSFNDRQLNRDLDALCLSVNTRQPRLPDGRHLQFVRRPFNTPISDMPT